MSTPGRDRLPRAVQSTPQLAAKQALRTQTHAARAADPNRSDADAARLPHLLQVSAGHTRVAAYFSLPPEPDTTALIDALARSGVEVLLPVLQGHRTPAWAWYAGPDALAAGWRGIPEPTTPTLDATALASCSLIWVSALRATPDGRRLGTGGGWYDRALLHASPHACVATLIGDDELIDSLPHEPWDLPVDLIVTPTRTVSTRAVRL